MEGSSSSGARSSEFTCKICGKTFDSSYKLRGHMSGHARSLRRKSALSAPPVTPIAPTLTLPTLTPTLTSASTPPLATTLIPPATSPEQPPPWLGMLIANLVAPKPSEVDAKVKEAFMKFIEKLTNLPLSFLEGMSGGLKDAMKGYVKETLREELSSLREELLEAVRKEKVGAEARSVQHSEVRRKEVERE